MDIEKANEADIDFEDYKDFKLNDRLTCYRTISKKRYKKINRKRKGKNKKKLVCSYENCLKVFNTNYKLNRHQRTHLSKKKLKYNGNSNSNGYVNGNDITNGNTNDNTIKAKEEKKPKANNNLKIDDFFKRMNIVTNKSSIDGDPNKK